MTQQKVALSLFWRTFFLLLLLLAAIVAAWAFTLRAVDVPGWLGPRNVPHLTSLLRLSAEALRSSDRANRPALLKNLAAREGLLLQARAVADVWTVPAEGDPLARLGGELRRRLGPELVVASSLNGRARLWFGFVVEREAWWLQVPAGLVPPPPDREGLLWVLGAVLATLAGAVLIAQLINQPLRQLSFAASKIRGGEFDSRLDETTITSEIREVNMASTAWRASWPRSRKTAR